jgi:hypothetical protein
LPFSGQIRSSVKFHRAKVDVLLHLEAQAEQDAFLQNAGFDIRMADGAEEDRRELAEFAHRAVRQDFPVRR